MRLPKLFNRNKNVPGDEEIHVFQKEKKTDETFYKPKKALKRLKWKTRIVNSTFVLTVLAVILLFVSQNNKVEITRNTRTDNFLDHYITNYYTYPKVDGASENDEEPILPYSSIASPIYNKDIKTVEVVEVSFTNLKIEKKSKVYEDKYDLIIKLRLTNTKDTQTVIELQRQITVLEDIDRETFGVTLIKPVAIKNFALAEDIRNSNMHTPEEAKISLNGEEIKTAESRVILFLNQYNDSYIKALDLVEGSNVIERKPDDITYEFVSIKKATKNESGEMWYINAEVSLVGNGFTEKKMIEIHFNVLTNRINYMEVY